MLARNNRILLINPAPSIDWKYKKDDPNVGPPLGVLSVGTLLKNEGFSVNIVDAAVQRNYLDIINEQVQKEPLFIGFSVMTSQIPSALEITTLIKRGKRHIPLVWGGVHPTLFPEQTLKDDLVDIVVRGFGEYSALELAIALKDNKPLDSIKGIGFKVAGILKLNEGRDFVKDMDTLPSFDYELLEIEKYINRDYLEFGGKKVRTLMVYGAIGCPYKCAFCINSIIHNSRYVFKSAQRLLDEIEFLIDKYKVNHINFRDENLFANKQRIEDLLIGIEERNLKFSWEANVRANYFNKSFISKSFLKRLQDSGCILLGIGAESGDNRVLKMIDKDIRVEDILYSAAVGKEYRVTFGYSFMMAIPGETKEQMVATSKLILNLMKINKNNYIIGPQIFRPYPGSKLYQECVKRGLRQADNLRGWAKEYLSRDIILDNEKMAKIRFPWIDDISFVRKLHFYTKCACLSLKKKNLFKWITRKIISSLSKLRIGCNLLQLPLEYILYCRVQNFKHRII